MSIRSQIDRINSNIAAAYTACSEKGATMPVMENSDNLAGTIAGISSLSFEIAAEKPVSNIKTNVIYLIPNSGAQTENIYDEWIYVNNAWELIGSTAIDLSQYAKKTEVNSALATKADSDVVKPLFTKIIEDSCDSETLTRYNVLENKKIVFSGGATNDENYDIDRYYPLTPGTLLKIKATADSDYTYQFQRTTSMGSANLVSGPFSGDVDDYVVIPDNAVCLSICRSKTNTTNSVTLYSPILPDVSESVTKKLNAPILKQSSLAPDVTVSDKLYDFLAFSEQPLSGSAYSDFSVQQGNVYMISGMAGQNALHYCLGGFFDASDNLLQSFGTEIVQGGKIYTDFVVTAPSEAVKVRVNSGKVSTSPILCFSADYDMDCIPALRQDVAENTETMMASNKMLGVIPFETKIGFYKADGSLASDNRYECGVAILDVTQGEKYLYKGKGGGNAVSVILYDSSDEIVSTEQWSATDYHEVVIPSGVTKALFTSMRVVASDPVLMFELYKTGGIYNLYKKANPQDSAPRTLNLTNRLYAAETMGVSRQVDLPQGKAVFCVGFDDYNLDCLGAVQYLASQGLPCYLALIPDNVTDDWAMARLCYENGGEIVAHSGIVLTDQNQTFELMNDKFVDIPAKIGEAGFPVYGIIRAGGTGQGTENRLLDEFYCRAAGLKYSDYYGESPQYTLGRTSLLGKSVSEWENYLDDLATNGGFCIAFCHHTNGSEKKYKYTETGFLLEDHLKPIMAHAKSLMNNPSYDFEIITINEFVDRYVYKTESFDQGTQSWTHSSDGFVRT